MLNLFDLKKKKITSTDIKSKYSLNFLQNKISKHFPSPLREWKNSIYLYNKNYLNLIPSTTVIVNKIIKSYFNLYNRKIEVRIRSKRLIFRFRRLSSNKYYISTGGFKHSNNKVLINLYVFNRQRTNYLRAFKNRFLKNFLVLANKTKTKNELKKKSIKIRLINRFKLINKKVIESVKMINKDKHLFIKALNSVSQQNKNYLNNFKDYSKYTRNFYKKLIKKSLKKIKIYFFYKQLLYINKSKINYTYLQYLKKYLESFYNKNVEFNIINLKRFYLNSDLMCQSINLKLKRKRKGLRYLKNLKGKISIKKTSDLKILNRSSSSIGFNNKNLSHNQLLLKKFIINNLKYRHITGFRLEASGRLNKRSTASRSVHMLKYSGNLLDIDSSYRGMSSVLLKGNLRSNTQYTKLNSKSRIGSFGLKGWISGN